VSNLSEPLPSIACLLVLAVGRTVGGTGVRLIARTSQPEERASG
jgi:hypothetical protein